MEILVGFLAALVRILPDGDLQLAGHSAQKEPRRNARVPVSMAAAFRLSRTTEWPASARF